MKFLNLSLILLFLSSVAPAFPMLSSEEFNKLDQKQKIEYVSGLQKIFVQMAEKSPLMAGHENYNSGRQPANEGPFFPEELSTSATDASFSGGDRKNGSKPQGDANPPLPTSPKADVAPKLALSPGETLVEDPKPKTKADRASINGAKSAAKPEDKKRNNPTQKTEASDFRCMHSGWIIEGEKCQAPEKVPESWGFEYVLRDIHKCAPGLSLCNPLIFGLQLPQGCNEIDKCTREAKAFCSSDVLKPTADCYRQANANDKSGTKVAVALLSDLDKSKAFLDDYKSKMTQLCDAKSLEKNHYMNNKAGKKRSEESKRKAIQDVLSTCEWAKKQLSELNLKVASSGKSGQSSQDSEKPRQQEIQQ